jgi:hypothetical protein
MNDQFRFTKLTASKVGAVIPTASQGDRETTPIVNFSPSDCSTVERVKRPKTGNNQSVCYDRLDHFLSKIGRIRRDVRASSLNIFRSREAQKYYIHLDEGHYVIYLNSQDAVISKKFVQASQQSDHDRKFKT